MKISFITALVLIGAPLYAHGQIEISEIMYDLEGSDSGGEWIEVYNTGSSVDLSAWRFFENDTNHYIEAESGDGTLSSGAYAIIADDPPTFRALFPSFNGQLFKSSFSLNNTGETLEMRDADLVTRNSVTYSSSWGAAGTGESLQKSNGSWTAAPPTPGESHVSSSSSDDTQSKQEGTSQSSEKKAQVPRFTPSSGGERDDTPPDPKPSPALRAYAGEDRRVLAGTVVEFIAAAYNEHGDEEDGITYTWNFGDATTATGQKVTHIFYDPGRYAVTLHADETHMNLRDSDQIIVDVEDAAVEITDVSGSRGAVSITNNTSIDVDVSGWIVEVADHSHSLPDFTTVLSGASVTLRLPAPFPSDADVALRLPSGDYAHRYVREETTQSAHRSLVPAQQPIPTEDNEDSTDMDKDIEEEVVLSTATSSLAAVGGAETNSSQESGSLLPWILSVIGLALVAGASLVAIRRDKHQSVNI